MKKFALIAGAAALVFPALAHAKTQDEQYTYKKVDMSQPADNSNGEYRIEMQSEKDFSGRARSQSFTTIEGEQLQVDGKSVYKTADNGDRFFAPNGSYETKSGLTVVVEDGQLDRIEKAPSAVMFGSMTNNNSGRSSY
jgi:hypothetical protein